MDNEKFQELVLKKLDYIERSINQLINIEKNYKNKFYQAKTSWKPYFDLEAMDEYCKEKGVHPADLSGEEMKQFKLRERQPEERSNSSE